VLPYGGLNHPLLFDRACLQDDTPDLGEVGVDKTVAFPCVMVRYRMGNSRGAACIAGLPASPPCLRRLSGPQCAVADREKAARGNREQTSTHDRRHDAARPDGHQVPESKDTEQGDEGPGEAGQRAPGALVMVAVEVQGNLPAGQHSQKQHRPHERGALATVEGLGGEVARHAVHGHRCEREARLTRQRRSPPRMFGLDGGVGHRRLLRGDGRLFCRASAAIGNVSGMPGPQALILDRLVGVVDVADQDRGVICGEEHPCLP
jgi:hypothetical protein